MNEKYLETGKIVSTHGIKGEVKVLPWADAPEFLLKFKTFYLVGAHEAAPRERRRDGTLPSGGSEFRVQGSESVGSDAHIAPVIVSGNDVAAERRPEAYGNASLRKLTVESARVQKTCVLLKFKGIDTVEDAQTLRDKVLYIARDDPRIPAGTVFHADLIGLPVRANGAEIGKIKEILSMPASDVWVVKGEKEYMIPHVKAFVPAIDLSLGYVDVNLIEGMETNEN